jgi:hypothetical protein
VTKEEKALIESGNVICLVCGMVEPQDIQECLEHFEKETEGPGIPCTLEPLT